MKIEHLQYFITLANSSSISKAAEQLFISQQQLNRIITALEEDVQAKLFFRTTNGISLTEDGSDFLAYAKNIVSEYSAMKSHFYLRQNQIGVQRQTKNTECKVFLPPTLSIYASDISHNLKQLAPNIKLTIYDKTTRLNEGYFADDAICFWALDIAPGDLIISHQKLLQTISIGRSQSYFAYNSLLNEFHTVPEDIRAYLTITFFNGYSLSPHKENLNLVSTNVYQLLDYVLQNNDVCALPDFVLPKMKPLYPDVAFMPLQESFSPLTVAYPMTHKLSDTDEIVINFMKSYIQNLQMLAKQMQ